MKSSHSVDYHFRTRYNETDQMGVIHNAVYQIWFEMGRTEFCRVKKLPYTEIENQGIILVVAEATVRFKKPAFYDEDLYVSTHLTKARHRVFQFDYQIVRKETDEIIAEGHTVHVSVDKATRRPIRLPAHIFETLTS